jgi:hypothetical protein
MFLKYEMFCTCKYNTEIRTTKYFGYFFVKTLRKYQDMSIEYKYWDDKDVSFFEKENFSLLL